jgi:hypothetical protein
MQQAFGFAQQGGQEVVLLGYSTADVFQKTFPFAQITVNNSGTIIAATLYSDNLLTPLSNPFTANANGFWYFYAANGRYDVLITPTTSVDAPFWLYDILLYDPAD